MKPTILLSFPINKQQLFHYFRPFLINFSKKKSHILLYLFFPRYSYLNLSRYAPIDSSFITKQCRKPVVLSKSGFVLKNKFNKANY